MKCITSELDSLLAFLSRCVQLITVHQDNPPNLTNFYTPHSSRPDPPESYYQILPKPHPVVFNRRHEFQEAAHQAEIDDAKEMNHFHDTMEKQVDYCAPFSLLLKLLLSKFVPKLMTHPPSKNLWKEHTTHNSPDMLHPTIQVLPMLEHDLEKLEGHPHQHHLQSSGESASNGEDCSIGFGSVGGRSMSSAGSFDHLDGLVSLGLELTHTPSNAHTHARANSLLTPPVCPPSLHPTHTYDDDDGNQDPGGPNGARKRT